MRSINLFTYKQLHYLYLIRFLFSSFFFVSKYNIIWTLGIVLFINSELKFAGRCSTTCVGFIHNKRRQHVCHFSASFSIHYSVLWHVFLDVPCYKLFHNSCRSVVGELDEELDSALDLSNVRAHPLKPVIHWSNYESCRVAKDSMLD